eukprot:TRINITY_DN1767_c0_g1_i1.p1 TRINITY_DN1767_c0_g1~~TRINITY_DN1767_c0_g1_i1.p1  ORF type:complete len:240 (+),score=25.42 TRINITY_DN1767_c0_g1_i1:80-721(+)
MDALPVDLWEEILQRCDVSTIGHFLCTCNAALSLSEPVWKSLCTREQLTRLNGDESWAGTFRDCTSAQFLVGTTFCYGTGSSEQIPFGQDDDGNIVTLEESKPEITNKKSTPRNTLMQMKYAGRLSYILFDLSRWHGCPFTRADKPLLLFPASNYVVFPMLPAPHDDVKWKRLAKWLSGLDLLARAKEALGDDASFFEQTKRVGVFKFLQTDD